jgi:small subunit ribosomal protein S17e
MGRVRNKVVKRAARSIVEKYYMKLDTDFHHNKRVTEDVAIIHSKRIKNKVAGYATRLMRRVQKGVVKGIYIKKQEEERERRENFIPKKSILDVECVEVDPVTMQMISTYSYRGNFAVPEAERVAEVEK